jgi:flavin reductase (DIM6/NTAB) family NADH-FMN oxidoreductase RutF
MSSNRVEVPVEDLFGTLYWPPLPAMLVSSLDPTGEPHVAPYSLVYFASYANVESVAPTDKVIILGIGGYATPEERKSKRTYHNIVDSGEFVINVPPANIVRQANRTGFPEDDKFAASGLTPIASANVKTPGVAECMVSFECKVFKVDYLDFGNDLFWGKVVAVRVDRQFYEAPIEQKLSVMRPLYHYAYSHDNGTWYSLGEKLLEEVEPEG